MRCRRALTLLALPLLLTGCVPADAAPGEAPAPVISVSPTPAPSPSAGAAAPVTAAALIPDDCRALVDDETYRATFGDTPLNDPLVVGDRPASGKVDPSAVAQQATDIDAPVDRGARLRCTWKDPRADVSYLAAIVSEVDPATSRQMFADLQQSGYTCTDRDAGEQCQLIGEHPEYPVTEASTYFVRDDVVIAVFQANVPTDDLMGSFIETIWAGA